MILGSGGGVDILKCYLILDVLNLKSGCYFGVYVGYIVIGYIVINRNISM